MVDFVGSIVNINFNFVFKLGLRFRTPVRNFGHYKKKNNNQYLDKEDTRALSVLSFKQNYRI